MSQPRAYSFLFSSSLDDLMSDDKKADLEERIEENQRKI